VTTLVASLLLVTDLTHTGTVPVPTSSFQYTAIVIASGTKPSRTAEEFAGGCCGQGPLPPVKGVRV